MPAGRQEFIRRIWFFFLLFIILSGAAQAAQITGIEIDKHKHYDNLTINTSSYIRPKVYLLNDPPRLVIDFKGAKAKSKTYYNIKSKRI